ncbi:MAG: DUF4097 family beta strand repeat-containing protein [Xanthomonadales bacterium]|nr:DUF4097 family beta strand repeat-containing protein [Xanthomonadales bacterium]
MKTALVLLLITGSALAAGTIDEVRPLAADGMVVVKNVKGEVNVESWDRNQVSIQGELGDGTRDLAINGGERRLEIEVVINRRNRDVEESILEIRVPERASLAVETVSADVSVEDLNGELIEVNTVSGDVDIDSGGERIFAHTVSGDLELESRARRVELESVSGDIDARAGGDEVDVNTVSGDVLYVGKALARGHFEAVSGDMEIDVDLADSASLNIASLSGDVDLIVPRSMSATCEAESFSGKIKSTRGEVRSAKYGPHKSLRFVSGDGSGRIKLESYSGDLRIREK